MAFAIAPVVVEKINGLEPRPRGRVILSDKRFADARGTGLIFDGGSPATENIALVAVLLSRALPLSEGGCTCWTLASDSRRRIRKGKSLAPGTLSVSHAPNRKITHR